MNSEFYPYDDLNVDFGKNRYVILFDMYAHFRKAYYTTRIRLLRNAAHRGRVSNGLFVVIDCARQV